MSLQAGFYFMMNRDGMVTIKNTLTGEAMMINPRVFAEYIDQLWEEHF